MHATIQATCWWFDTWCASLRDGCAEGDIVGLVGVHLGAVTWKHRGNVSHRPYLHIKMRPYSKSQPSGIGLDVDRFGLGSF